MARTPGGRPYNPPAFPVVLAMLRACFAHAHLSPLRSLGSRLRVGSSRLVLAAARVRAAAADGAQQSAGGDGVRRQSAHRHDALRHVSFIYYGTREIRLVKPGYETLTVNQPIPAPWYQIPPIDFASENLAAERDPGLSARSAYNLTPQVIVPTDSSSPAASSCARARSKARCCRPAADGRAGDADAWIRRR